MLYRGIYLNDNYDDFYNFKNRFINRMISRYYHPAQIRKILKLNNIPKYRYRQKYLENSYKRLKSKRAEKILFYEQFVHKNKFNQDEIKMLNDAIIPSDESDTKTLFFIKTFQNLFDDDNLYRKILNDTLDLLPMDLRDKINIIICNKIDNKIRKYLN